MPKKRSGASKLIHRYTNLWVEGFRSIFPDKKVKIPSRIANLFGWPDTATTEGKDLAYVAGHAVVYGHIPVILGSIAAGILMIL